jgi:hypothetical protein
VPYGRLTHKSIGIIPISIYSIAEYEVCTVRWADRITGCEADSLCIVDVMVESVKQGATVSLKLCNNPPEEDETDVMLVSNVDEVQPARCVEYRDVDEQ